MDPVDSRFLALFNNIPQGCMIYRLIRDDGGEIYDWIVEEVNSVSASVMGLSPEKMKGLSAIAMFGNELFAPYLEMSKTVIKTGASQQHEIFFPLSGRHYLSTIFPIDHDHVGNTNFDFTERVLADKSRADLLEKIQQKNNDLEALIHSLSHDLRAPLVNLHGFNRELSENIQQLLGLGQTGQMGALLAESEVFVRQIETATKRIDVVSAGVLRYARLGNHTVTCGKTNVQSIVDMVLRSEESRFNSIQAKIDVGELFECFGEETMLSQVFSNLIDNSIKYRSEERPLHIRIRSEIAQDKVIYHVIDNGIGVRQDLRERIFDLFFRTGATKEISGDGIGLSLVRRSVSLMGGEVWVSDGDNGVGSCFSIQLGNVER